MARSRVQPVSLDVAHLGLVTSAGPALLPSVVFAEAGLAAGSASPFFKSAADLEEPREPIAIQSCPWLEACLPYGTRITRLTLRAAHEALDAWAQAASTTASPSVWLVAPRLRPGVTQEALSEVREALWRDLRPRNVRVLEDETGAMQAILEIRDALSSGEPAALLLAVDSFLAPAVAAGLVEDPVGTWEPLPPTPSEAAAAVLFTSSSAPKHKGAHGRDPVAQVVAVGTAKGPATETNDELQDGLAMTALLEGLEISIRPEVVLGPAEVSLFRSREWEMAACRAPNRLAPDYRQLDVSSLYGWVGAASTVVSLVYAIAATRLALLTPAAGDRLTAVVWGLGADGARGILGVRTTVQPEHEAGDV